MPEPIEVVATALLLLAVAHTFFTPKFDKMARGGGHHAGLWHLLGEVEIVFGFWATVLLVSMALMRGGHETTAYMESRNFTEPMFVAVVMIVAASRPILQLAERCATLVARVLPFRGEGGFYFAVLSIVPLLGSVITEAAAMTLAALMLKSHLFPQASKRLKYATLGVLFTNISIGGMLTSFAAPPVLLAASAWGWDNFYVLSHFGWKAAVAVVVNATLVTLLFHRSLAAMDPDKGERPKPVPRWVIVLHLLLLAGVVSFSHHPAVFIWMLALFAGFAWAYPKYQDALILRQGVQVGFFLAGIVVLVGLQHWWLEPLLSGMGSSQVFFTAAGVSAFTDNAGLVSLGIQVGHLTAEFKDALTAGVMIAGGLTLWANAPNAGGAAILKEHFVDKAVNPWGLLAAALLPTVVAGAAFMAL